MEIQLLFFGKTKKNYLLDELEAYKKKYNDLLNFPLFAFMKHKTTKKTI